MKCWICEVNEATTGEHLILKSAYDFIIGQPKQGEKRYFSYIGGKSNIPIESFKNNRLKFKKSICSTCNNSKTQPYDIEFLKFVKKVFKSKSLIISRNKIPLNQYNQNFLALYFLKVFGCLVVDQKANILEADYQAIRQSLLSGKAMTNNIFLSAHRCEGKQRAKQSATVSHHCLVERDYIAWTIDLDWFSIIISYPLHPIQSKYGSWWSLNSNINNLKMGKV